MATVLQYDPKKISIIIGGVIVTGYSDGTFVQIERNEDAWALKVGCDGTATRAKSNNSSGRITVTLQQSSATNDAFSAIAKSDELANTGVVPCLIRDNLGRTLVTALSVWVVKYPSVEMGKETMDRAWVFESDNLVFFVGGN